MATFKFVLRPSTRAGRHPGTLSLRVIHHRKPKTVSIYCHLFPDEWDAEGQTIIYPEGDPARAEYLTDIEQRIITCADKINEITRRLEKQGAYTVNEVITYYRRATGDNKLLGYAQMLAAELRDNKQFRTAKAYGTVSRRIVAFNQEDIPLGQIDAGLVKRFETFMKDHGRQPNTISFYMRNLRAIFNRAVEAGRIPEGENPFAGTFTGVEETKKRALSVDEVNRLRNIDFDNLLREHPAGSPGYKRILDLYYAWRLFFFCLYAQGMCFIDLANLKKSHVKEGMIRYYRKKTGKQIEVPVNEGMQTIIDSFAVQMRDSPYLFPIAATARDDGQQWYETAMRTQNRKLKKLAALAGLDKGISTHVARHSWATICKNELLPLSVISEGLGHSSEKMTRKYLASFDRSILGNAGKTLLTAIARTPSG